MKKDASARIRILFVSGSLGMGGAERLVSTLLQYLDRSRFEPFLCLFENRIDYLLPRDIPIDVIGNGPGNIPRLIVGLKKVVAKLKPDIVFSNIALPNRITSVALRGIKPKPYWIARIGSNPFRDGRTRFHHWINYVLNNRAYQNTNSIVVNSVGLKKLVAKAHPKTIKRVTVLHNPTDFSYIEAKANQKPFFPKKPGRLVLINVGRLHPVKRHDLLIKAFAYISKLFPVDCHICGTGYLQRSIEQEIKLYDLTDRIKMLGYCENPYSLMRQADLFVLTSDSEGMPNVLIEAMSLAVPIVSTDCSFGPIELIDHGKTGMLAKTGDAKSIAHCIEQMLLNQDRKQIGRMGAQKVRSMFDQKMLMSKWQAFIENVLMRKKELID